MEPINNNDELYFQSKKYLIKGKGKYVLIALSIVLVFTIVMTLIISAKL